MPLLPFSPAALNGAANAVSFQSVNIAGSCMAPCSDGSFTGVETNRMCLMALGSFPYADGSFLVVPGLSNPAQYSFQVLSTVSGG